MGVVVGSKDSDKMVGPKDNGGGTYEGLARGLSQALTYVFELHKTSIQVYGSSPKWTGVQWLGNISRGIWQSSLSSGLVFHTYFTVYHSLSATPWASLANPIASLVTSSIKIPIGNCMRVMQANPKMAPTVVHAGALLTKNQGARALYSGYSLSLIEDMIEMDLRIRLYDAGKALTHPSQQNPVSGFAIGALAGAFAAAITTPFDTLRAQLAFHASQTKQKRTGAQILASICATSSPPKVVQTLYRGMNMRALSTGVKTALFYSILEMLMYVQKNKEKP